MKSINVAINGMGRIGRTLLRLWAEEKMKGEGTSLNIVAVNNPGDAKIYTHLTKYDSCHGTFPASVSFENGKLTIDRYTLDFYSERDPANIPWDKNNVDIVIDCTGKFKEPETLGLHLRGSVKKVVMCAPGKNLHGTFVMGVNHHLYNPKEHHIFSNASCTTNCLAPVAKVLQDTFGIESGLMTTVHAYTSDQMLLDGSHKDFRRARAAALSMIPTSTGAAKSIGEVIPALKGKLDGVAVRVPCADVSMVDLTVQLKKKTSKAEINSAMKTAAEGELKNILAYCDEELVSIDFKGRKESSIFDASLTQVTEHTAKIVAWYDNEVGFSQRVLDLVKYVGKQ